MRACTQMLGCSRAVSGVLAPVNALAAASHHQVQCYDDYDYPARFEPLGDEETFRSHVILSEHRS